MMLNQASHFYRRPHFGRLYAPCLSIEFQLVVALEMVATDVVVSAKKPMFRAGALMVATVDVEVTLLSRLIEISVHWVTLSATTFGMLNVGLMEWEV